jgi:hypothetical protein
MVRPRAADDFVTIRARVEELRRERAAPPVERERRPPLRQEQTASATTTNPVPHRLPRVIRQKFFHHA